MRGNEIGNWLGRQKTELQWGHVLLHVDKTLGVLACTRFTARRVVIVKELTDIHPLDHLAECVDLGIRQIECAVCLEYAGGNE